MALIAIGASPATQPRVIERLMPKTHSSTRPTTAKVDTIVLHFSSDLVSHPDHPYDVENQIQIYDKANVSAHYLIDREGTIYKLVDEKRAAWHAGKGSLPWDKTRTSMNSSSIGIEMLAVGSKDDMAPLFMSAKKYDGFAKKHPEWIGFTDAQYASLEWLISDIQSRWPEIKHDEHHIIGHEDWAGRKRRTDPGQTFDWKAIGITRK
ncbi:MAG TPA: N-acetylmuramoyl-L-alanine amidase [Tepidisphaeraceae bacterium]|nr:N-acetylmuramoyl-L-alanine amidase [Tepidisphaeraceae bacterium]